MDNVESTESSNEVASSSGDADESTTNQGVENGEGLQDQDQESQENEKQKVIANIKKLKLKVDGEEFEEEIDLNDEARLIKELQLARAAKKRMAEASEKSKKAWSIIEQFEKDPMELISKHPKGFEIAEQILLKKLQDEMMTPEEKAALTEKSELEQLRAWKKEQEDRALAEKAQIEEARYAEHYQKMIIGALEQSQLPKSPELVKRLAYLIKKNEEIGIELDATDLANELKSEMQGVLKALTKDSDAATLLGLLGDDIAKKIRKHDIEKLKAKQFGGSPTKNKAEIPTFKKTKGYISFDDWREQTEKKLKGLKETE